MIEIRCIKEMAEGQVSDTVPYSIVQEIAYVLLGMSDYDGDIPEATAVSQPEVDWLLQQEIDFMHYLGGHVFICETESDLQQVTGMDFEFSQQHGRWPSCTEAVLALDDARILYNANGTAEYALLFAATNNAGGPSWFIPRHLWQAAQIDKQIKANHQFWQGVNDDPTKAKSPS